MTVDLRVNSGNSALIASTLPSSVICGLKSIVFLKILKAWYFL